MKIEKYLSQSPIFALYRTQGALIDNLQRVLMKEDVHLLQGLILTALFFEERDVRPFEISSAFQVSKSNLSHALRGLEKKGFLKRSMHSTDARGYLFNLTSQGKKKALNLVKLFDEIQDELEKKMGVRSFRDFVQNLETLIKVYNSRFSFKTNTKTKTKTL
ncbi:MAG: MarR family transcriptional regulator [Bdellovibrionales bacterium]|nr:MarR family transcriptional regulator [Bdellovibrionales bacterium]